MKIYFVSIIIVFVEVNAMILRLDQPYKVGFAISDYDDYDVIGKRSWSMPPGFLCEYGGLWFTFPPKLASLCRRSKYCKCLVSPRKWQ